MARSVQTIQTNILNSISANSVLSPLLTSTSLASVFNVFAYVIAVAQNLLEQDWDDYLAQIQTYASQTPAASTNWMAAQAFSYQYDPSGSTATNQLTILSNGAWGYATVNSSFNIITRCAVNTTANNTVQIKIAQGTTPAPITGTAFTQAQSYFQAIGTAGINYNVISLAADNLVVKATIYFKPGCSSLVQSSVPAAIQNYLNNIAIYSIGSQEPINYEGLIEVSGLEDAIFNADGVSDVDLQQVLCYPAAGSISSATTVYNLSAAINNRNYIMAAGYAIVDNTNTNLTYQAG